jgi:hypothetical protein
LKRTSERKRVVAVVAAAKAVAATRRSEDIRVHNGSLPARQGQHQRRLQRKTKQRR